MQRNMQAMLQRTLSHSFAMSSGCKGAPSQHATPPMASAHTQAYINASKHCLSRQHRLVSAFSARLLHRSSRRTLAVRADADYGASWKDSQDAFLVLGLAHCFEKDDNGKLADCFVIEPISANSLECMAAGGKTCFKEVKSVHLGEALSRNKALFPEDWSSARFCEDFEFRAGACARTWMRTHAQDNLMDIVPLGRTKSSFNYSLDDKRVLNFENVVNDDDNIKQDISIDVYGRTEKEEEANGAAAADEEKKTERETEEDELDSLLAA